MNKFYVDSGMNQVRIKGLSKSADTEWEQY